MIGDGGDVMVNGRACGRLSDEHRTAIRRAEIGFVYQFHHLLPEFSALENIMIPQIIRGLGKPEAEKRAAQLLDYMRIAKRGEHRPAELSGGELQRVAIACVIQANAIRQETQGANLANRQQWARETLSEPAVKGRQMLWAALGANAGLTKEQIEGASDAALLAAVANAVDLVAGA